MSWGVLNHPKERHTSDPLPDFFNDYENKSENNHNHLGMNESMDNTAEKVLSQRQLKKKYGIAYPTTIDIRLTRKSLFLALFSFAIVIMTVFCIGYIIGGLSYHHVPIFGKRHHNDSSLFNDVMGSKSATIEKDTSINSTQETFENKPLNQDHTLADQDVKESSVEALSHDEESGDVSTDAEVAKENHDQNH